MKFLTKPTAPFLIINIFFLGSLAATATAWAMTARAIDSRIKERFYLDNLNAKNWIETRLNTYFDLLTATQAFVSNSQRLSRPGWTEFSHDIQIAERYPGFRAVIYTPKVKRAEREQFAAQVKRENSDLPAYANYTVHPEQDKKDEFYPVLYTYGENIEDRLKALGQDVSFEKTRLNALDFARDNNRLTLSAPVTLVIDPHIGFAIALPVYQKGLPIETVEERRLALTGFVYAPFEANAFFDAILKPNRQDAFPKLDLEIYDPQSENPNEYLYDKNQAFNLLREPSQFALTEESTLLIGNRTWTIRTGLPKKFITDPQRAPVPLIILASGTFASIFTFSYLLYQYHHLTKKKII